VNPKQKKNSLTESRLFTTIPTWSTLRNFMGLMYQPLQLAVKNIIVAIKGGYWPGNVGLDHY
jgi:hypothetical protein